MLEGHKMSCDLHVAVTVTDEVHTSSHAQIVPASLLLMDCVVQLGVKQRHHLVPGLFLPASSYSCPLWALSGVTAPPLGLRPTTEKSVEN